MNRDGGLIHEFIRMLSDPAEAKSPLKTMLYQIRWSVLENEIRRFVPGLGGKKKKKRQMNIRVRFY